MAYRTGPHIIWHSGGRSHTYKWIRTVVDSRKRVRRDGCPLETAVNWAAIDPPDHYVRAGLPPMRQDSFGQASRARARFRLRLPRLPLWTKQGA